MVSKIIFDQFSTRGVLEKNLSELKELLEGLDIEVMPFSGTIDSATLTMTDSFLIPGKDNTSYTVNEKYEILDFVKNGGILIVLSGRGGDSAFNTNLNSILGEFGIQLANNIVKGNKNEPLLQVELSSHPVTQGISSVLYPHGCSLLPRGKKVKVIGSTGKGASPPDAPLIAETTYRNGKIAVLASWRLASNQYIDKQDNKEFLKNLFAYLFNIQIERPKEKKREVKKEEKEEKLKKEAPVKEPPMKQPTKQERKAEDSINSLERRVSSLEGEMSEISKVSEKVVQLNKNIEDLEKVSKLSKKIESIKKKVDQLAESGKRKSSPEQIPSKEVSKTSVQDLSKISKQVDSVGEKVGGLTKVQRFIQDSVKSLTREAQENKSLLRKLKETMKRSKTSQAQEELKEIAFELKKDIKLEREELKKQRKALEELRGELEDIKEGLTHLLLRTQ